MGGEEGSLGELAVTRRLISREQLQAALDQQARDARPLSTILIEKGLLSDPQVRELQTVADKLGSRTALLNDPLVPDEVKAALSDPKKQIGRFVLVRPLGRGGMGEVWKAWSPELHRYVAIKFLLQGDEIDAQRLMREAKVVAKLDHPNIIPVHDVGESDRGPFVVMKFVEGDTLDRADLTLNQKLMAVRDAALALEYAHRQGVVHRDLKPQNIMVEGPSAATSLHPVVESASSASAPAKVYVMDFGLAKQQAAPSSLSGSGIVAGTPEFMPPEQALGRSSEVDARSDVYALGATLYRIITGVPVFSGENALSILQKVLKDEPLPMTRFQPKLPRDIETIVLKCLEKDRTRRYSNCLKLAEDIQKYLNGEPIEARPASLLYRAQKFVVRRKLVVLAATLASTVIAYAGYALLWPGTASVTSVPAGAAIYVDGRDSGQKSPAEISLWPPGKHSVELRLRGYDVLTTEANAAAGQVVTMSGALTKNFGYLKIDSTPKGAEATLEGTSGARVLGRTPVTMAEVERGTYRLVLRHSAFQDSSDTVIVKSDAVVVVDRILAPETGELRVEGNVEGIQMRVESAEPSRFGARTFPVPTSISLPTGRYQLIFEKQNHFPRARTVTLARGQILRVRATLNRMEAWSARLNSRVTATAALADLNHDGFLDAVLGGEDGRVTAISGKDSARLWEFQGRGSVLFAAALADVNEDGVPDALVGCGEGGLCALSGKDGSLLWSTGTAVGVEGAPAVADLNGDGVVDAIVTSNGSATAVSGVNGTVLWQTKLMNSHLSGATLADLNGDGIPDAVVVSIRIVFALSGKDGSKLWQFSTGDVMEPGAALADLDGDGVPDCVVGSRNGRVFAISGRTGKRIWMVETGTGFRSRPLLSDVDGDGIPDCLIGSEDGIVMALSGKNGSRLWSFQVAGAIYGDLALADLDGDGILDLIVGSDDGAVLAVSGKDRSKLWEFRTGGGIRSSPVLADLNADGILDCVVGTTDWKMYVISTQDRARLWESAPGVVPIRLCGDLDGDGIPDCIGIARDTRLVALSGEDGSLIWDYEPGGGTIRVRMMEDVNADGAADFLLTMEKSAIAVSGKDGTKLWEFKANGKISSPACRADINGDGVSDVIALSSDGCLYALSGKDGAKLWESRAPGSVREYGAGTDFDRDGLEDFLVRADDGTIYALSGKDGRALWQAKIDKDSFAAPLLVDLNGDGTPDCVVSTNDHHLYALSGRDGSELWRVSTGNSPSNPLRFADLNGDGVPDFVVCVQTMDSRVIAVSGRDGSTIWSVRVPSSGLPFMSIGDLDGDGVADFVLEGELGREVKVWTAISGKEGRRLWEFRSNYKVRIGQGAWSQVLVARLEGDREPSGVTTAEGILYVLSGKEGWVRQKIVCDASSVMEISARGGRPVAIVRGYDDTVKAVALEHRRPLSALVTSCGGLEPRLSRAAMALREAEWEDPTGRKISETCARLLEAEKDLPVRRYLMITLAQSRMDRGELREAEAVLQALRSEGGDSCVVHACLFLCRPASQPLVAALERDPVQSLELLLHRRELWEKKGIMITSAMASLSGRAKAAACILHLDFDLAQAELMALGNRGESLSRIAALLAYFPADAGPYLTRARQLNGEPARAAALATMAMARSSGAAYAASALLAAKSLLQIRETARAAEILDTALRRSDLPPADREKLQGLRDQCGNPEH